LQELDTVGPVIARRITEWLEAPPDVGDVPEVRAGYLTLSKARAALATAAAYRSELRGDLQMHTTWSDGGGSVREMAAAAVLFGHSYIAITDHSKGLKVAGGMNEEELAAQADEIAVVDDETPSLRILHGIEMNLSPSGEGDMDPDALRRLDIVLGSFHSALRITDDQTERYLAALRNPDIHVLGHPRGRMFGRRPGLRADWPRVFDAAAAAGIAVEIDAFPDRQDLQVDVLRIARDSGVTISIGTDAHAPFQFWFVEYGLAAAILAGIERERILNFMEVDELLAWTARRRGR
jgi:histidinol phosphatase-like PHP family hydrolase